MNIIHAYGIEHLFIAAGVVFFAAIAAIITRNKSGRRLYPAVGIFLLLTEILKQLLLTHVRGSYSWSDLPFQLCSVPMYLCLIYRFFPEEWIDDFIMVFAAIGAAASLIEPTSSFTGYTLLTIHSLLWHGILLALALRRMIIFVRTGDSCAKDYIRPGLAYLIAAGAAVLINTYLFRVSSGTCNMFFLGPGKPCVIILDSIYSRCGWAAATLVMITATELCGAALYLVLLRAQRRFGHRAST